MLPFQYVYKPFCARTQCHQEDVRPERRFEILQRFQSLLQAQASVDHVILQASFIEKLSCEV